MLAVLVSVHSLCIHCCPLGAHWLSVVQSREVSASQRFQMYNFYRKSNWGHGICLLYRGCLPFGESVIRGITVGIAQQRVDITCSRNIDCWVREPIAVLFSMRVMHYDCNHYTITNLKLISCITHFTPHTTWTTYYVIVAIYFFEQAISAQ